ncbi:MAG: glycosyltransferase [Deltaproteobacteria bacterium]|nr:glycosyltransferase [Deltaproteobacteria bacterium]
MNADVQRPDRRRLLLLSYDLDVWGAQRQLVELAKGLDPNRYDVRVGTLVPNGPLATELAAARIPVVELERTWRWDLSPLFRLRRYLKSERIDIVHSFLFLPNFYARFAGRLAGTAAVISSLRAVGIEGWPRFVGDVATCVLCDAMIANSAAGAAHYVAHGGLRSRVVVVRNGFPQLPAADAGAVRQAAREWNLDRFGCRIGMIAALEPRKDQALLVRAFAKVLPFFPDTGLVLAGDGVRRPQIEQRIESLGIAANVVLLGKIQTPHLLHELLDIYVQASASGEGISNSILEAMSHACPVVATDVGGNPEVVLDERTGYIVPAGDVDALADRLRRLLDDADLRRRVGYEGKQRVQTTFSVEQLVAATCEIYDRVLSAAPLRARISATA